MSREELAPGAGVFPARGSGGAWAPGGVEPRRARPREELGVSPEPGGGLQTLQHPDGSATVIGEIEKMEHMVEKRKRT